MTPDTIVKAIKKINLNAQFTLSGTDLDSIVWQSGTSPIAKSDIETKINEVETEHNNLAYAMILNKYILNIITAYSI